MLQEATRAINTAFNNSFIKSLSLYLHDCVREEVKSSTFRNLKADKDNKWIFLEQEDSLFTQGLEYLKLEGSDPKLTELMIQSESSQKDKYLIYGYLFLAGKSKSGKKNEFLTPLLYSPCHLERNGVNINCMLTDEFVSLNTGALTALMKKSDDEDETEQLLEGLLDVVPSIPITEEKLNIFLTTLKSIVPDVEISLNHEMDVKEDNITKDFYTEKINGDNIDEIIDEEESTKKQQTSFDKIHLTNQCAIILTKRPSVTAGVLHELTQISEKPSGVYRETVLNLVNEEYTKSKPVDSQQKTLDKFFPVTPLSLSDAQLNVIKNVENAKLVSVFGPPGTGKSQTIVNLVAHLIANGKTVLVASRMDKAVDVVAERLNNLGAPFLALRAGRLNYQRELSMQLQDLLSNKVDLDEGIESSILCDTSDMEALLKSISDMEKKAESIISLEKEWTNLYNEIKLQEAQFKNPNFIKSTLKGDEISEIESVINTLTQNMEKSGFWAGIKNSTSVNKLKKILHLSEFAVNNENLMILKTELEFARLICNARILETKIQAIGNIHVISEQIRTMRKKQKKLAIDILKCKRREALKGLMQDPVKRQRLFVHSKSLVERKKNLQNRVLETEDFKPLLEAFPCWCVTTYAVSGSLPMKPGLFDVVIIDEASQCDIASCFPILFRAKRAVVVGDDKQLPHLSFLEKAKEQSFMSQYGINDKYQLMWRFRTNSMFDLANYYSMHPVLLDEHFRSLPPIINYSNKEFYGNRIKVMRRNDYSQKALEAIIVPDGKVDFDATRNLPEIETLVKKLHEIVVEDERNNPENPVSIGIISPFRAQVEQLKISVSKVLSEHMMEKHQIEIGTAHTFQGDERDIMLISWAYANNSFPQSLVFLQKPNLFNVAVTRARYKTINFISKNPRELPEGILRSYFGFIEEYENRFSLINSDEFDENIYKNSFEKEVAQAFRESEHKVICGSEIAGLSTDLLIDDKFIVECDGVDDKIPLKISNMRKQAILERTGLKVNRISYREWQYSKTACIERIINSNL
ncbi:MAG: AAA domain-containing protein [bacterium]|nr:AAA domain-containing protein [bacterium]